jgi:hypothetical protein
MQLHDRYGRKGTENGYVPRRKKGIDKDRERGN